MKNIIIAPIFSKYMSGRIWMGLDIYKIKRILIEEFNFIVNIIPFDSLVYELDTIPEHSSLFYATSYNKDYLQYTKDTVQHIADLRNDIVLLPNLDQLRAFENKGYQEYLKEQLGIDRVLGKYYGDINDLIADPAKMNFPFVLKLNEGALSSGVSLMHSEVDLLKFHKNIKRRSLKEKAAFHLNKKNSFSKDSNLSPNSMLMESNFEEFFQKRKPVVTQEFIPSLTCDYKVLVFGDKYFVIKRATRENDFRASGSGKFEWVEPPFEVLNYAKDVCQKMQIPFVSLDIGIDSNKICYLFEFQGTAFGPLTLTQSDKYFTFQDAEWKKTIALSDLEHSYAYAINFFVKNGHENN